MNRRIIYIVITASLAAGCSRVQDRQQPDDGMVEFAFTGLATKAGAPSDVTYRMLLLDVTSRLYTGYNGSYRQKDAKDWMTPCQVSAAGVWMADDSNYGLRANAASTNRFCLTVVSPAKSPDWDVPASAPEPRKRGYSLTRGGDEFFISHPVEVTVNGNHLNRKYVYEFPQDNLLIDRRARITVRFQCGDDLTQVHVKKVEMKDVYQDAKFNLATDSIEQMTADPVGDVLYPDTDPQIDLLHGAAPTTVTSDYYLFALNYVARDEEYHYIYTIPRLLITMADDSQVSVPFYHRLLPQYSYTYTLTINSAFVKLDTSVEPWHGYDAQDAVIEEPVTGTFAITPAADWIDGGGDTGTI